MASLQEFHNDVEGKENVHKYFIQFLTQMAVEKVFNGEDVKPIAAAKEVIDAAFDNLDILFPKKPKRSASSPR